MSSSLGNLQFKEILQDPENLCCFDCGKTPAQWASINNSIFLCISCSGIHRGFGVQISFIKSITLDSWNENQIKMMRLGGNKNCRKLLEKYEIDKNKVNKTILYHSKIMNYYRIFLKNKVNNIPMEIQAPSNEEALKNFEGSNINNLEENKFSSVGNNKINEKKEEKFFSNIINKAYEGTKDVYNKIGEMKISEKIKNVANSVKEKGNEIKNSNFAKSAQDTLSYYVNWMIGNKKDNNNDKRNINNINEIEKYNEKDENKNNVVVNENDKNDNKNNE
jgi:ADP-ribosylation factor GTPase-activating protein 1